MDLRPKIAGEIVDALLDDLGFSNPDRHRVRTRWVELALSKIVSHSIEFPRGEDNVSTSRPEVVEAFLAKYPRLRGIVADCRAKAAEIDPGARVELEVTNDPEGCHTCHEGQTLHVQVLLPGGYDEEWRRKDGAYVEWWAEHPDASEPERDPVFGVFLTSCGFLRDEEEGG